MKKTFPGFYNLSDKEIAEICDNCIFVIDANILLNLYRYPDDLSKKIIDSLRCISDRLWIPHQAALEYFTQRTNALVMQKVAYSELENFIKETKDDVENHLKGFSEQTLIDTTGSARWC